MFPPRCPQPPCRNIEVSSVLQKGYGIPGGRSWPAEYSRGHHTPGLDERLQRGFRRLVDLDQKRQHIERDQPIVRMRRRCCFRCHPRPETSRASCLADRLRSMNCAGIFLAARRAAEPRAPTPRATCWHRRTLPKEQPDGSVRHDPADDVSRRHTRRTSGSRRSSASVYGWMFAGLGITAAGGLLRRAVPGAGRSRSRATRSRAGA